MKTVTLITGGFDPLHSGHIDYINAASNTSDSLIVGINSNEWLQRKKGHYFLPWSERAAVISNLKNVNHVIDFDDSDLKATYDNQVEYELSINKEITFTLEDIQAGNVNSKALTFMLSFLSSKASNANWQKLSDVVSVTYNNQTSEQTFFDTEIFYSLFKALKHFICHAVMKR